MFVHKSEIYIYGSTDDNDLQCTYTQCEHVIKYPIHDKNNFLAFYKHLSI